MSAPEFKVGDVVRLKSGGPLMTVHHIRKDDQGAIAHVMIARNDAFENLSLPAECLECVEIEVVSEDVAKLFESIVWHHVSHHGGVLTLTRDFLEHPKGQKVVVERLSDSAIRLYANVDAARAEGA